VVTAITHMCDTSKCKELFQSSPALLTVNQAAGAAANAAAAAAAAAQPKRATLATSFQQYDNHKWSARQNWGGRWSCPLADSFFSFS
jgi:hypothetical protein